MSGDNAVVIALAARSLPKSRQLTAIAAGSGAAVVLRIVLTLVAAELLLLPWLKMVGAALLMYIGISLLLPEGNSGEKVKQCGTLGAAIRTILIADLVMSLDNVIAVAAAAHDDFVLLVLGLTISVPLVVFGSALLLKVTERFPIVVWLGGALLGYIAGEMLVVDPALKDFIDRLSVSIQAPPAEFGVGMGALGAIIVLASGKILRNRKEAHSLS